MAFLLDCHLHVVFYLQLSRAQSCRTDGLNPPLLTRPDPPTFAPQYPHNMTEKWDWDG